MILVTIIHGRRNLYSSQNIPPIAFLHSCIHTHTQECSAEPICITIISNGTATEATTTITLTDQTTMEAHATTMESTTIETTTEETTTEETTTDDNFLLSQESSDSPQTANETGTKVLLHLLL